MAQTRTKARPAPVEIVEYDERPPVSRWLPITAFVLSLYGFGASMYLTIEHYTGGIVSCPAGGGVINCQKVTTSAESKLFGIPVALLGLLFFTALLVVNFPALWRVASRRMAQLRLAMVVAGMGFVIYLLSAELFAIKAICLWCTSVHVVTFVLFIVVVTSYAATSAGPGWGPADYGSEYGDDAEVEDGPDDDGPHDGVAP